MMPAIEAKSPARGPATLFSAAGSRKNLVMVRAGNRSLHAGWLKGAGAAEFDLLIAAYEDGVPEAAHSQATTIRSPGAKIAGYADVFRRYPEVLQCYDFIALFDDDVRIGKEDIERLFRIGRQYRLDLFQPALSHDSFFSYAATLANPKFTLRYTNTVEMMCPVFSSEYLRRALPLFRLGYETGIDLVWTRLADSPWFRFAIVDAVVATHTQPGGARKERHGFRPDEAYEEQIHDVLSRFGATFRGFVSYAGIDRNGRAVCSRTAMALYSIATWAGWRRTPMRKLHFARLATDFTRHGLFRPVDFRRIELGREDLPP